MLTSKIILSNDITGFPIVLNFSIIQDYKLKSQNDTKIFTYRGSCYRVHWKIYRFPINLIVNTFDRFVKIEEKRRTDNRSSH